MGEDVKRNVRELETEKDLRFAEKITKQSIRKVEEKEEKEEKKEEKTELSLSEKFGSALQYFAPQLGGLAADLISGGGDTGTAGLNIGTNISKQMTEIQKIQQRENRDAALFLDKKEKNALADSRIKSNVFKEISKTGRQDKQLERRDKAIDLKYRNYSNKLEQQDEFSAADANDIGTKMSFMDSSDRILGFLGESKAGKISGNLLNFFQNLTGTPVKGVAELKAHLLPYMLNLKRALTGTAASDKEHELIVETIGKVGESPALIAQKIGAWKLANDDELYNKLSTHKALRGIDIKSANLRNFMSKQKQKRISIIKNERSKAMQAKDWATVKELNIKYKELKERK